MPKLLTIILDGWGLYQNYPGNAIAQAKTPTFDQLWQQAPHAQLACSGLAVGLPEGQMGTSEVNHMTIGAGRVIFQDLVRINQDIESGQFFDNPEFIKAFNHVKQNNSKLHIKGLYSPGGVHSHQNHIKALIKAAKKHGLQDQVYLHLMTDGRDTKPQSALEYIKELEQFLQQQQVGQIASLSGRYFAMDRDKNWDRTDLAFKMMTQGQVVDTYDTASKAIEQNYQHKIFDEFIKPSLIKTKPESGLIQANDAVIFANFRTDRPRQLVERFLEQGPANLYYLTMTQYNPDYQIHVAYPPQEIKNPLGQVLSEAGLTQLRVTETEKFAHLTFFMNCKQEDPYKGEERIMFNSDKSVKTYDENPAMRTPAIKKELIKQLESGQHPVIFTNLCNADMVGHTGQISAAIKGIETIDQALSQIIPSAQQNNYQVIITADHGNAEQMLDPDTLGPLTAHTTNPVPFILLSSQVSQLNRNQATMADVAPTILKLLGLKQPPEMTGQSLV
ncbi:MAG: 2,3-bisphosphoglycerate-independent phosphoglycerate mutase [Candidatus Pacebacteria bacterium]|nr:2,3-bisphosphoglycerate-independent phosphoglycerate mutase [Candidatus Paceibacterota bacterium]